MKIIIDRFEGDYAVCETYDRKMIKVEKSKIPPDAKEGDVIEISQYGAIIDHEETEKRRDRIKKLMDDIWEST